MIDNPILNLLYKGTVTIQEFNYDNMTTVPLYCLISDQEIAYIKDLIMSPRYSGNNKLKMVKIDEIMHFRGFTRFAGGTNRLVYIHPMAPNAVFKVAIDSVGINDNPAEYRNQFFLKPYCCKVFECSRCGTIASFEKVDRITTIDEFVSIADDYYYLLSQIILGKYVMDDIGIKYFMNVGIRRGFGPVILDFPYCYELDGDKLECGVTLDNGSICRGEINYDHGFNKLICEKCGCEYRARDLSKEYKSGHMLIRKKGGRRMKINIMRGDTVVKTVDTTIERDHLSKNDREVTNNKGITVAIKKGNGTLYPKEGKIYGCSVNAPKSTTEVSAEKEVETSNGSGIKVKATKPIEHKEASKPVEQNHSNTITRIGANNATEKTDEPKQAKTGRVIKVSIGKKADDTSNVVPADKDSTSGIKASIKRPDPSGEMSPKPVPIPKEELPPVNIATPKTPLPTITDNKEELEHKCCDEEPVEKVTNSEPVTESEAKTLIPLVVFEDGDPDEQEETKYQEAKEEALEKASEDTGIDVNDIIDDVNEPDEEEVTECRPCDEDSDEEVTDPELKEAMDEAAKEADENKPIPRIFFYNRLPNADDIGYTEDESDDFNTFYCIRKCDVTEEMNQIESTIDDPTEIDLKYYDIYQWINRQFSKVGYDFNDEKWYVIDDEEETSEEAEGKDENPTEEAPDSELVEEAESSDEDSSLHEPICITKILPTFEEADEEYVYCVPLDSTKDVEEKRYIGDIREIDQNEFSLYFVADGALRRVTYNVNDKGEVIYAEYVNNSEEEDEDIEAFKNAAKKPSLEE